MKNFLKRPTSEVDSRENKFEIFNLKSNPFPAIPAINKENSDNRYNGEIFESKIREEELNKILKNFLLVPQNDSNHLRVGYIKDTSYIGRGNGKSAFSINLLKIINQEFCLDISNDANKCFGLYVSPEASGRTKSFYSLLDLIFESIINSRVIEYCLATIRLESIIKLNDQFDIEENFKNEAELIASMHSVDWFQSKAIVIADVVRQISKNEFINQIPIEFPLFKDRNNYSYNYVVGQKDFEDYYKRLKPGKDTINFIFTDLVNFFLGCGFNGAYIIIDDFERIPDFQTDRQKREFALELRNNFFDGVSTNAKVGFYNLFLILHAGVPRLIEKAWSDTGMEQRSPISSENENDNHVIFFEKLTTDHAQLLVKKYLKEFRVQAANDDLSPFTTEAISYIAEIAELNAAGILQKANYLLERAADQKITTIDLDFIKATFKDIRVIEENHGDNLNDESTTNLLNEL